MNRKFLDALDCINTGRAPFIPAIYEHKAWFVGETPSTVCRDTTLFTNAILEEYDRIRPDALVVGIDVYNVEAEAAGSEVSYFEGDDCSIPAIGSNGAVLREDMPVSSLKTPDPAKDGRMPLNLEVARRVFNKLGSEVTIRGAVSGPFSMAANLVGAENLFLMTLTDPERVHQLLAFASGVAGEYGRAFAGIGCGVIIFDSQSSPDLLSPSMYRDFILEPTKNLVSYLRRHGFPHVPLIIGGNTTPILDSYIETGANNILCDAAAEGKAFLAECSRRTIAFRRNIDSRDFLDAKTDDVQRKAVEYLDEANGYGGFILGTGVVPYGTPTEILAAIRDAVEEFTATH